ERTAVEISGGTKTRFLDATVRVIAEAAVTDAIDRDAGQPSGMCGVLVMIGARPEAVGQRDAGQVAAGVSITICLPVGCRDRADAISRPGEAHAPPRRIRHRGQAIAAVCVLVANAPRIQDRYRLPVRVVRLDPALAMAQHPV